MPPLQVVSGPPKLPSRTERGTGRRTHYAAPTRPPVCVSGSRTRPTLGEDYRQGCRAMLVLSGCTD